MTRLTEQYILLDNPGWHALQTVHKQFAAGTTGIQRYPANVLRIAGCAEPLSTDLRKIEPWVKPGEKIFIIGDIPPVPANWINYIRLDCVQMVCTEVKIVRAKEPIEIFEITEKDHTEMVDLVNLVMPGFFFSDTYQLGNYYGIRQEGKLVAITGERLKMTGLTEVSAVVTHPEHTGHGYAQQLVAYVAAKNLNESVTPFLHFLATNDRARKVYELVGFEERRIIPFCGLQRVY